MIAAVNWGALPDAGFWRGRRVFVTGHTGFKGAWLCAWLARLGADVAGFALPSDKVAALSKELRIEMGMRTILGDVRDADAFTSAMTDHSPEIVLHLAAQSLVRLSYREPVETFATNVMGTVNLLEAVRRTPSVRAAIVVTSDKCYENRGFVGAYRETDRLGGADPYSTSKACAELVTDSWRRSFFPPDRTVGIASVRAGNVIGGGDWAEDRLVPDCIAAFSRGTPIVLRNPDAYRPWQHVLDPLCGYLLLAERLAAGEASVARAWNFGPALDEIVTVADVAERLAELWGGGASWIRGAGPAPHEAQHLAVDSSLARLTLRWTPRLKLSDALAWTLSWYQRRRAGEDAARLVAEQLAAYEARTEPLT